MIKVGAIKPFIPLVVVLILFLVAAKFGLGKLLEVRDRVALAQKNERTLTQKLALLNEVSDSAAGDSLIVSAILPSKNPGLITAFQVKTEAASLGLVPVNIKSGGGVEDKLGLSKVNVNFEIEGPRQSIFVFFKTIESLAPITRIEKFKLSEVGGISRAEVAAKTFYADFPKKLPALTDALNGLTAEEEKILTEALKMKQPQLVSLPVSSPEERVDPFSF